MWCDQLVSEASTGAFSPTPSDRSVWEPTFEDGLMSEGHKSWWTESVGCICFLLKYSRLYIKDLAVLKPDVTCRGGGLDWDIWYQLTDSVVMVWINTEAVTSLLLYDVWQGDNGQYNSAAVIQRLLWFCAHSGGRKISETSERKQDHQNKFWKKITVRHRSRNVKMRLWILSIAEENLSCYKPRSEQTGLKKAFGFSERLIGRLSRA